MSTLYSLGYTFYSNYFTYIPKNNNYEYVKLYHEGTLILLKENIKDIHLPTLVIIPGTTGDTENLFFATIVDKFIENGFNVIFILQQGQKLNKKDPIPISSAKCISFVDLSEMKYAMKYIKEKVKNKIFIMGASLGALLMKKYLYDDNDIVAGISVCSPWNLRKTLEDWDNSWLIRMLYDKDFTNHYKNVIQSNIEVFKKYEEENPKFKINDIMESKNIKEVLQFHVLYNKFESMDDYLSECKAKIKKIKTPILFLHNKDDPVCHIKNMPVHKIKSPHQIHISSYGGHVGYTKGIEDICLEWYKKFMNS